MAGPQFVYVMKGLSKTYPGGKQVLKDIWLSFYPGAKIGINCQTAARLVRELEADIAIDLNGHTQDNLLGVFSQRPAPIQVSYLGFPGTMGADFIDYVLADATTAPFSLQPFFREKIVHLPDCYFPNDRSRPVIAPPTRAEAALPETGFVFACFNSN